MKRHYIFFIDISEKLEFVKNGLIEFLSEKKESEPFSLVSVITLNERYNIIVSNEPLNTFDINVFEKIQINCDKLALFDTLASAMRKILEYHNVLGLKGYDTRAVIFVRNLNDTSTIVSQSSLLLQFIYAFNKGWKIYFASPSEKLCLIFRNIGCEESLVFRDDIVNLTDLKSLI